MNKLAKAFGKLRFRNKMLLSTLAAALVPLLLCSFILGIFFIYDVSRKSSQLTLQVVNQTSESLDIYISTIEKLMNYVIDESCHLTKSDEQETRRIENLMETILKSFPEITGITIAYEDDSYISAGMSRISRDLFADEQWYQYAVQKNGDLGILANAVGRNVMGNLKDSSDSIFSLTKSFEHGVVLFDIRHDMIQQLINLVSIGEEGFLYVVDDNDVVYTPLSSVVYRIDPASYNTEDTPINVIRINGSNFFVANHLSDYSGWRVIGVVPERELSSNVAGIYQILAICVFMSIILAFTVSLGVSSSITKPISKLSKLMEKAEAGDFSVRFHVAYQDEIGVLGSSFNHMLEKIDQLITELYAEKQSRLEAQLKSLQEQIKPHFLYNTLDTISWMARGQGAMDVVRLVDALTNMFRVGLSKGKDYISLCEEKIHVTNYLYIQKVRYGDKLQYSIEIPEEYDHIIVPKLILQPLVENAIYHGIKLKRGGGLIRITAEVREEKLYIHVWDNGAGMSADRLRKVSEEMSRGDTEEKGSFGLPYISKRIELSYGSEYGVSIESQEGVFTEVTLCLPVKNKREGEAEYV